ncbi:MAG: glycosyltransferase family 4 protein [Bacteroidia bacterium]
MRILQLCNRVPWPPKDGGAIGMYNFTKSYHALGCEVSMLAINTPKHYIAPAFFPPEFATLADIQTVDVDTRIKPLDAFLNIFSTSSYNIVRFDDAAYREALTGILKQKQFDVVHVDGLFMSMYANTVREHSDALLVMRAHNVEHIIWQRMAETEKPGLKKQYLRLLARRLRKYEEQKLNEFDALLPISEVDDKMLREMGSKVKHITVPAGVDPDKFRADFSKMEFPSLFHLGALDWLPNQQAVRWFLQEVWPEVSRKFPELSFHIAGRHIPEWVKQTDLENVIVAGEVDDAAAFMNSKAIMIVPLLSGSGVRLKVLEGMALGKAIVSTTVGAEGIEYRPSQDILIADSKDEFIKHISYLVENRESLLKLGQNAIGLIEQKYTNRQIVKDLLAKYESLIG